MGYETLTISTNHFLSHLGLCLYPGRDAAYFIIAVNILSDDGCRMNALPCSRRKGDVRKFWIYTQNFNVDDLTPPPPTLQYYHVIINAMLKVWHDKPYYMSQDRRSLGLGVIFCPSPMGHGAHLTLTSHLTPRLTVTAELASPAHQTQLNNEDFATIFYNNSVCC